MKTDTNKQAFTLTPQKCHYKNVVAISPGETTELKASSISFVRKISGSYADELILEFTGKGRREQVIFGLSRDGSTRKINNTGDFSLTIPASTREQLFKLMDFGT